VLTAWECITLSGLCDGTQALLAPSTLCGRLWSSPKLCDYGRQVAWEHLEAYHTENLKKQSNKYGAKVDNTPIDLVKKLIKQGSG